MLPRLMGNQRNSRLGLITAHVAAPRPAAVAGAGRFSLAEVAQHVDADSCWIVVRGEVYDVTDFLEEHPGGKSMLMSVAGSDASATFDGIHADTEEALAIGAEYKIGAVVSEEEAPPPALAAEAEAAEAGADGVSGEVHFHLPDSIKDMTAEQLSALTAGAAEAAAAAAPHPSTGGAAVSDGGIATDTEGLHGSAVASWNSGGTADVLPYERSQASFDVEKMINILDGGEEETVKRRWIIGAGDVAASTELFGAAKYDLPRDGEDGAIASAFEHFMRVHGPWLEQMYVPTGNETMYMSMGNMMGGYPGFGLFMLTMLGQTSDEQKSWWMEAAYSMQMTGAYAQTELGHGSNVRGLQTTATYDAGTEEWILDTPTLAAMKWWPSNLVMATHCVLYAQMIIDGVEQGVHVFMLQLRDENLEQLSGVEVGDIGTKVGDNNVDIGYLRLNEVRIPRRHLMEKRQHVEADGTYVKHGNPNASAASQRGHYLTMMSARIALVGGAAGALGRASTIAIRYSLVRRQGFKAADGAIDKGFRAEENQIIDYRMNQYTLLKNLAFAYAERFTSNWVQSQMDTLVSGDDDNGDTIMELHAVSAGLKGYCCNTTAVGIEELRKCCGGAGYLIASGIAALEADFKWRATAEGDTSVMLLQTARYLLAQADAAKQGLELAGLTVIFAPMGDDNFDPESLKPPAVTSAEDFFDLDFLLKLFEYRTVTAVYSLNKNLQKRLADGEAFEDAWGALTLKACKTGQSHILFFMLAKFIETARDDTLSDAGSPERTVLARLAALFALSDLQDGQQWAGLLSMDAMELAEDATGELMSAIRPDACTLVDSWDFPDRVLNSTIGGYDGNVYEAQYKAAAESPLNQTKMPRFIAKVEPFLDKEFLKLRNGLCVAAIEDADEWEYSDDEDDSDDDWDDDWSDSDDDDDDDDGDQAAKL